MQWICSRDRQRCMVSPRPPPPHRRYSKTRRQASEPRALLVDSGELVDLPGCHRDTRVRQVKELLEITAGIPSDLQRLSYLDEGDLADEATLCSLDTVAGATLGVRVWQHDGWHRLVTAALRGDPEVLRLGVTDDLSYGDFRTPHAARLSAADLSAWRSRRAFVALFVAAHRNHAGLVGLLLRHGASASATTPCGRTALHAAAASGSLEALHKLLRHGAPADARDAAGLTALELARRWAPRSAGADRAIFRFVWHERAEAMRPPPTWLDAEELMAHQRFDSVLRTTLDGRRAQRYQACLPPVCPARGPAGQGRGRGGGRTARPTEKSSRR
ncbi:ankyrin repeat domain-containing protein 60 [Petromyzon marinus]|uniref:Ankyrin repeat domain-containing protein 60 n=2 Tax=Petromyzon marinus TaxID=7757 RepID=A0AAJ7UCU8_PETMA|nr:ankyrin repeat domain-containing protein 60 [Petromyzon marinus]XP_032832456.1 ankyrin repeat domain-containing protein 60 [Petromyzon marinus]XP_032832457.1 ankyrin repeat domain-containing protein 60 [Petromyzon marinus]XP_032832458.1 ankyrin repeat domain-containing protein 60 [Petromyzon marinus]XP_032832459.1 ankyrin repeat domain-containing protein 60 [Petromyzon marinus]